METAHDIVCYTVLFIGDLCFVYIQCSMKTICPIKTISLAEQVRQNVHIHVQEKLDKLQKTL